MTKRIASQHVRMPANANVLRTLTLQHRQPLRRINGSVHECMSSHNRTDIGAGCHTSVRVGQVGFHAQLLFHA